MAAVKEYLVTHRRKMEPTHPGALIREDVLPALGMSVSKAARELRISRQSLHRILSGRQGITPETALRIGKFCGNGPGLWLRMQVAYDLWHAERRLRAKIARIPTQRDTSARRKRSA